jgi:salicylate biosynthesis isochorismate synthase
LTVSLISTPDDRGEEALHRLAERWERLTDRAVTSSAIEVPATMLRVRRNLPEAQQWRDSVARLAGAVGRGRVDKVVLSRQVELEAASPIDVPGVLRRLSCSAPESTVFAVARGARAFVGATPERLVSVAAREFETMAMAGSVRRADDAETDSALGSQLLQSDKEREEHAVVVAMLREALGPVTETLHVEALPQVLKLRHVQHLLTLISGRLREDAGVLALVERLHPTPAVGGAPRELALQLIADEEHHERGWYAGPLGWVDGSGDGEFVVALRSGVIDGAGATLFAGCGIMADSDPEREWEESSTKLLALGSELGRMGP